MVSHNFGLFIVFFFYDSFDQENSNIPLNKTIVSARNYTLEQSFLL